MKARRAAASAVLPPEARDGRRVDPPGEDAEVERDSGREGAGVLEQGDFRRQIQIASSLETISVRVAEWRGAVFVKGSRRYQLERALAGATAPEAAHA